MRCSRCGGEILPDMVFSYETMKKPIYPEYAKILSEALEGKEFCCGHCLQNYTGFISRRTQKECFGHIMDSRRRLFSGNERNGLCEPCRKSGFAFKWLFNL